MTARSFIPALLAIGLALPAAADTISVLRENTLTLTYKDGKVTTILIKEGQDLEQVNGKGVWAAGFWALDSERGFCWTARGESSICVKMPMDADIGVGWDVTGPNGEVIWKAKIVAGREDLKALSASSPHKAH